MVNLELIVTILLATLLPLITVVVSSYFMRRSGMLPAQQRLDDVLKTTVDALQIRVKDLEDRLRASEERIKELSEQHKRELQAKEAAIVALQTALSKEQILSDQLRVQLAEANQKVAGFLAAQQLRGIDTP